MVVGGWSGREEPRGPCQPRPSFFLLAAIIRQPLVRSKGPINWKVQLSP